ncbi:MAG TPA: phage tail protein [Blastococcus sp.]|nr:phage tail protein [Blastococcus sp.]
MGIRELRATPHPVGHRIDLTWSSGPADGFPGVRVVRREGTHPTRPDDGVQVAHGVGIGAASDTGLRGETVYYYALFPFAGDPPTFADGPPVRASALATASYDFAGLMYGLLPAIYRRYDATALPPPDAPLDPIDRGRGVLRRYLELPGSVLDQLYSLARSTLARHDPDRVDERQLASLAQWIGWRTDHGLSVRAQRKEVRFAPEIYHVVGTVAGVTATVRRVTHRSSRVKEYLHNVARTNEPERLNLWAAVRNADGRPEDAELVSVNFAHDGRPAHARDLDGADLVLFHTYRRHGWDIWSKRRTAAGWAPSEPVVDRPGPDKDPAVARQGDRLWLFWNGRPPAAGDAPDPNRPWQLFVRTRDADGWSDIAVYDQSETDRRNPAVAVDGDDGLWLFWREWSGSQWVVRYNRHDGTDWQLDPAATLPTDADVDDDLIALFHPTDAARPLWLFWSHRETVADSGGQRRWSIAGRVKAGLDPAATDWSPPFAVPKAAPTDHDRDPAPLPVGDDLALYWASTRSGAWGLVRAELDVATTTWGAVEPLEDTPGTERGPLPVDLGDDRTLLLFRSNRPLEHLRGAPLRDVRYSGSTTVRSADRAKLDLAGTFDDVLTYTYDTRGLPRDGRTLAARDAVGVFLGPETTPAGEPTRPGAEQPARLDGVLPEALPVGVRAVVIVS